jgi:hypothetical protein
MDNKDALQIKIDEAKANLPEETKNAISAVDWRSAVLAMREKKGYSFSQLEDLEIETELLLYGLLKPEDYPKELETRMKISKEDSNELINQLNELIFNKIRNELVKNSETRKIPVISEKQAKSSEAGSPDASVEAFRENQNKVDNKVLDQSGIQIVSEEKKAKSSEAGSPDASVEAFREEKELEKREDMLKKVENPEPTEIKIQTPAPSFLEQKLGSSFKIPPTETKYPDATIKRAPIGSTKTDPYREAVE